MNSIGKTQVFLYLDNDILDWFRNQENTADSGNSHIINNALREHILHHSDLSEEDKKAVYEVLLDVIAPRKTASQKNH